MCSWICARQNRFPCCGQI